MMILPPDDVLAPVVGRLSGGGALIRERARLSRGCVSGALQASGALSDDAETLCRQETSSRLSDKT